MTDIDLDAIRAREQAATPGWYAAWEGQSYVVRNERGGCEVMRQTFPIAIGEDWASTEFREDCDTSDAEFIAHARTDIPALIDAVQRRDDALAAILALHPDLPIRLGPDAGKAMCGTCGVYAPCPTVAAITAHLTPADNPTTED